MRSLIIEDEARLARNIAKVLAETTSFAADISTDGEDGLHMALSQAYDLIILDLMLPKIPGLQILRTLRQKGCRTPVLILTARDASDDIIEGLDRGADDYLTKPFEMGELIARCKAMVRRVYDQPNPVIRVGDLRIDTASREVTVQGRRVILPAMEYRLLEYLAMREGQIASKTEIIDHLYDFQSENFSNTVEVYVSCLRRKIDPGPRHELIHTVRGRGYYIGERKS
ncbi:MAG: response regulator transcription factor [Sedimentisphaerales bacterium]|nr:response regulator transcription factor [Sedimentisphaerales bacterium]